MHLSVPDEHIISNLRSNNKVLKDKPCHHLTFLLYLRTRQSVASEQNSFRKLEECVAKETILY